MKKLLILTLLTLFFCQLNVNAQEKTYSTLGLDKYEELYNAMFPKLTNDFNKEIEYAIDVRIRPSFGVPTQVSVIKI